VEKDKAQIKIVSMNGQIVLDEAIGAEKSTLDIRSLRNGTYVLKVVYPNDFEIESQFTKF
jgi:2-C-methyl-D-erythritol 4-phosphate cytidylyltransferase